MTEIDINVNDCIKAFSNSLFHSLMTTTEAFFSNVWWAKKMVFFVFVDIVGKVQNYCFSRFLLKKQHYVQD